MKFSSDSELDAGKEKMLKFGKDFIQRGLNYFHHRSAPRVLVLLYHRVIDLRVDPQLLSVTPQHFEEHLEILCRYAQPVGLKELISALQSNNLPRRGVAITFDDGYTDNLHYAKPLLERYGIPATVFVTAGQLGRPEEFWWDELERLFLQPAELPETLSLQLKGGDFRWNLGNAYEYTEEEHMRNCGWHIEQPDEPGPRHMLYRSLYELIHPMSHADRQDVIRKLQLWAGKGSHGRPSHRALTQNQMILLAQGGLIEIAAHTMTHPELATQPIATQQWEIAQSKADLEKLLGHPLNGFAYPHGSYSGDTISLVQKAGFQYACSSNTDAVWHAADRFKLPRVVVRDWDGGEFARWIKGWFGR